MRVPTPFNQIMAYTDRRLVAILDIERKSSTRFPAGSDNVAYPTVQVNLAASR